MAAELGFLAFPPTAATTSVCLVARISMKSGEMRCKLFVISPKHNLRL